jgi:hypothetical protein
LNIDERLTLTLVAAILALAVSVYISGRASRRIPLLSLTTPLLTLLLLLYYHRYVSDPSHGMAIWVLPLATGWLWWRREHTGKPAVSDFVLVLLQVVYALLYLFLVHFQGD